ncbi:Crp/Fnr family transcriptional regulator [Paenibacillus sp. CGMCC 1.16610]|uniref:Cyclic nucleotide-binding domain-containing protein n=1 Tax=Paenibacillus anseongense TaxID=2682845 RepID=A0ABW9UKA1_9BACL|nr:MULTISPECIES: Crp/Fnr family transcriptional regulator [Paenibacillus]MBA2942825.1 Crp/Fnr family transcriptional regulator [Paenibacillus sp. CGMCC 1.16610]MVQ38310.1 cyclic nucleotide-binding domain-containing protein [Paenibacillus anseongense]
MKLHKGETLFRQGESGGLYRLKSGLLKIVRVHEDGHATLVNIIVPEETIPHHSLISPKPYYGTAVALVASEIETISSEEWYRELDHNPERFRIIAQQLQEKLRMMQQRIDQLTEVTPTVKLQKLEQWMHSYLGTTVLTEVLTQEEIGQLIGLRRETVNRLLREKVAKL